jgi:hypothetical protein
MLLPTIGWITMESPFSILRKLLWAVAMPLGIAMVGMFLG